MRWYDPGSKMERMVQTHPRLTTLFLFILCIEEFGALFLVGVGFFGSNLEIFLDGIFSFLFLSIYWKRVTGRLNIPEEMKGGEI